MTQQKLIIKEVTVEIAELLGIIPKNYQVIDLISFLGERYNKDKHTIKIYENRT